MAHPTDSNGVMQQVRRSSFRSTAPALNRRSALVLGASAAAGALIGLSSRHAAAVLKLDVTQGNIQPVPIAVPEFVAVATTDPAMGRNISEIIASNLGRSGLFAPINPAAFIAEIPPARANRLPLVAANRLPRAGMDKPAERIGPLRSGR